RGGRGPSITVVYGGSTAIPRRIVPHARQSNNGVGARIGTVSAGGDIDDHGDASLNSGPLSRHLCPRRGECRIAGKCNASGLWVDISPCIAKFENFVRHVMPSGARILVLNLQAAGNRRVP